MGSEAEHDAGTLSITGILVGGDREGISKSPIKVISEKFSMAHMHVS